LNLIFQAKHPATESTNRNNIEQCARKAKP